jgi:6-phosphogluconolactonase (cycloisomerase 2 family)
MYLRKSLCICVLVSSTSFASATIPTVTITSPGSGSSIGSPVNYVASASTTCADGISAMRIYTAPGVNAYTIHANKLNTNINLPKGTYSTVVQAWDKCGGVGKKTVTITVSKINLSPPKFLYATEYKAGKIAGYKVNPLTGSITQTSQGAAWAHWGPVDIASDFWGNHLYVANQGSHDVSAYIINRTSGILTQVPGSPFPLVGTGARLAVHPSGKFVYVTSTDGKGGNFGINAFAVQSNGSLTPVSGTPFGIAELYAPAAIAVTGKYLYVSARISAPQNGAIAAFVIDQISGALTPVPGSPFLTPLDPGCTVPCHDIPTDLGADSKGLYLYASLPGSDAVAGYTIDQNTGVITDLPGSPYFEGPFNHNLPKNPWRLSVATNRKFVYVGDFEGMNFSIFKMNASTGVLTFDQSINALFLKGLCIPYTLNIDPSSTFLFSIGTTQAVCQGTHALTGYSINQSNGNVISVPGSPFANSNVGTGTTSEEKVLVTR